MQSYRTLSLDNYKRFISSKQNGTILWLDNRRQLHFVDQKFHNQLLTRSNLNSFVFFLYFLIS